jgi:hypothetical protein
MTRALIVIGILIASPAAYADGPSKEVCLESHSRGQDARDQGKLSLARKLMLTCAQTSCPSLVQGDCARLADDLGRMQPTVGFVARDSSGVDLPDTTVYVDDMLVTTRLDDGKLHDLDPGKHTIRFVHGSKDQTLTVVVGTGEKGRTISATFPSVTASTGTQAAAPSKPAEPKDTIKRPGGAKALFITGAAFTVAGVALGVYGVMSVPDACNIGSAQCAAPPGDPVFDDAASAMRFANVGFIAAGLGVGAMIGGAVWYFKGAKKIERDERVVTPWVTNDGGGIAVSGRL